MSEPDYAFPQPSSDAPDKKAWYHRKLTIVLFCCLAIAFLAGVFLIRAVSGVHPIRVSGSAMEPTLSDGDRILVGRANQLKRGDLVVFQFPFDPSKSFIKRIVGLPGETISIDHKGKTFVNGSLIPEPYVPPDKQMYPRHVQELKIPDDEYFVMGDNRDASNDSRSWGTVPRRLIYGIVLTRYWHATTPNHSVARSM